MLRNSQNDNAKVVVSSIHQGLKLIDNFVLEAELGRGSFGTVHRARDLTTGRLFAIKVIERASLQTEYQKRMLMTEASILNRIDHPNVLHLHKFLKSKNNYYLVLDYCDQGELYSEIRSRPEGYLPETDALEFMKQIMNGFVELRRHRVIHRDIKTENIFLKDGRAVIGDFGLSKQGEDTAISFVGSRELMAPELLKTANTRATYDSRVDLWSLGILFYEMLFGKTPFKFESNAQILRDISHFSGNNLPIPREVSEATKSLLRGLITEKPEDRLDWQEFFNHPAFSYKATSSIGRTLFAHTPLQSYFNFDNEFQANKALNIDQLLKSESPLPALKKITRIKVTEVDSHLSTYQSRLAGYFINDLMAKYSHERNKTLWVVHAASRIINNLAEGDLSEFRAFWIEIALLLIKKATALTLKFQTFVSANANIWGFDSMGFQSFAVSPQRTELLSSLESDKTTLDQLLQKTNSFITENQIPRPKHFSLSALPNNITSIDRALVSEIMDFSLSKIPVVMIFDWRKKTKMLNSIALAKISSEIDRFFPFAGSAAITQFDWPAFYQNFDQKNEQDLIAIVQS